MPKPVWPATGNWPDRRQSDVRGVSGPRLRANRLIAFNDSGVLVHAMGKASAARITLRTVEALEKLAATIPPMAYDVSNYATLGLLSALLDIIRMPLTTTICRWSATRCATPSLTRAPMPH